MTAFFYSNKKVKNVNIHNQVQRLTIPLFNLLFNFIKIFELLKNL